MGSGYHRWVNFNRTFGTDFVVENKIRTLRTRQDLTQQELADAVNVTRQTINAIENNKYDPTLSLAFALAKQLQTTVDDLFQH